MNYLVELSSSLSICPISSILPVFFISAFTFILSVFLMDMLMAHRQLPCFRVFFIFLSTFFSPYLSSFSYWFFFICPFFACVFFQLLFPLFFPSRGSWQGTCSNFASWRQGHLAWQLGYSTPELRKSGIRTSVRFSWLWGHRRWKWQSTGSCF